VRSEAGRFGLRVPLLGGVRGGLFFEEHPPCPLQRGNCKKCPYTKNNVIHIFIRI